MKRAGLRAMVEVGFIVFLFYGNLLMSEFTHSGQGRRRGFVWAIHDIFTASNLLIAISAAILGYFVFEFFRNSL